jgi:hypothetical protein
MSDWEISSAYFMSVLMDRMKALIASSLTRNSKATSCRNGERTSQRSRILCSEVQTGSYLGEDDIIRIEEPTTALVKQHRISRKYFETLQAGSARELAFRLRADLMILGYLARSYYRILILSHCLRRSRHRSVNRI